MEQQAAHNKTRWLLVLTGFVLLVVAASKGVTIHADPKVLTVRDPLLGISYRSVLYLAIIAEALVGLGAIIRPQSTLTFYGLGWLGVGFAGYKMIRWMMGVNAPCKCMGHFLQWWTWGAEHEPYLSWGITLWLIGLSILCLFRQSRSETTPHGG